MLSLYLGPAMTRTPGPGLAPNALRNGKNRHMAIRIKTRGGESVEQIMRRFKKLCEKEGLTKDIKRKEFYEKPSERRRRDARKSVARRNRLEMFKKS